VINALVAVEKKSRDVPSTPSVQFRELDSGGVTSFDLALAIAAAFVDGPNVYLHANRHAASSVPLAGEFGFLLRLLEVGQQTFNREAFYILAHWCALLAGGLLSSPAAADDVGDVERGREYAQQACASCHAVQLQDLESPVSEATPFKMVADKPEMTRLALRVFLQSPQPSMPNLMVEGEDADNVIAYILSLKGKDAARLR
jgi:mono/diheme cytochrome c family protein